MSQEVKSYGVLVTQLDEEEKIKPKYLVKQPWEYHFNTEQWEMLHPDEKREFMNKLTLTETILDGCECLYRNKVFAKVDFTEGELLKQSLTDLISKTKSILLLSIRKLDSVCRQGHELNMIDDYEYLMRQKEKEIVFLEDEKRLMEAEIKHLKGLTTNTEENRANLQVFNSFQEEYKVIVDELLAEIEERGRAIDRLETKNDDIELQYKETRFALGNISHVEEKMKKMEHMYVDRLNAIFGHYSRTMQVVDREEKRVGIISSRLKEKMITESKASSILSEA